MKFKLLLFQIITFTIMIFAQGGVQKGSSIIKFVKTDKEKGLLTLINKSNLEQDIQWDDRFDIPNSIRYNFGSASSKELTLAAFDILKSKSALFGILDPEKELKLKSSFIDEQNKSHLKFQQYTNNIRIVNKEIIVHFNEDGSIYQVNGEYLPSSELLTSPAISSSAAISLAKASLNNYKADKENTELVLYEHGVNFYLAYEVKLPSYATPNMKVFVDALSGNIIKVDNGIRYDGPMVGTGVGLKGENRTINTYLSGGKYYLIDATFPFYKEPIDSLFGVAYVWDAMNDTADNGYHSAVIVTNTDNSFNDNSRLFAAVDAHYYMRNTINFFLNNFNRSSFDNNGASCFSVVHYGQDYNNAFWNGAFLTFGDGDNNYFSNLAGAYDVMVHEFAHAITQYTADLVYENQSGAINESMSDVFAALADDNDWLIGEDIYTPSIANDALRNMQDPHNGAFQGQPEWQPAHMDEFVQLPNTEEGDNGGVHVNSGIPNKAFYNVAAAITRTKAGKIWYKALTTYLTANSDFNALRTACINSAKDIYGDNSAEMNAVKTGFENVGITGSNTQALEIAYDDNYPDLNLYEQDLNWELATKFSAPSNNISIKNIKLYIAGDNTLFGDGSFTLKMYNTNPANGFPASNILTPSLITPAGIGWNKIDLINVNSDGDFFVSMKYTESTKPLIGADQPGLGRSYEFDASQNMWFKLGDPWNVILFMRATVQSLTGIYEISTEVPEKFEVFQNYPNPFNPSTTIKYALPENAHVNLAVYNVSGEVIADLVNNDQSPGTYEVTWNGKNNSGEPVPSGIYFYRINAGDYSKTFKMNFIK